MIYRIASLLRDEICTLNFVEVAAGLAKPHVIRNNVTVADDELGSVLDKVVPMAYNDLGIECEEGELYKLVPDTTKKSIVWWEDNGTEVTSEDTYYYHCRSSLMCVGWWNMPLIDSTLTDPSILVANIIAAVPVSLTNVDYFSQIRVAFAGEVASGAEVLSKYTFDDPENQYATYPYAVTGLEFAVDFAFGKNCVDTVSLSPSSCPPTMNV